jgi:hypothetical protein
LTIGFIVYVETIANAKFLNLNPLIVVTPWKLSDKVVNGKPCCPFMERMLIVVIGMERAMVLIEKWQLDVVAPINEKVHSYVIKK